jgi:hypothetical protein
MVYSLPFEVRSFVMGVAGRKDGKRNKQEQEQDRGWRAETELHKRLGQLNVWLHVVGGAKVIDLSDYLL